MTKPIQIALLGYGKMGKMVEKAALEKGHTIIAKLDSNNNFKRLSQADICIDFTTPDAALTHIQKAAEYGVNMVMGTTGWYPQLDLAKEIIAKSNIGFLYSPNFSMGIAIFRQLVKHAASILGRFEDYDVGGLEVHHNQKEDCPSGTAMSLADIILAAHPLKSKVIFGSPSSPLTPEEFHFASQRNGFEPGTHTISFDSQVDTISLTHSVRNREGFARGAILAAEWLLGKKGFFTFEDIF